MNTVKKGEEFELDVYNFLCTERDAKRLPFLADCVRIIRKKKYYSVLRGSEIEFDIAIELYRMGASQPTLTIVVECKNYSNSVPVGEIESFIDKMHQVHAHKGIIVSRSSLQKAGLSRVRNGKLGYLRFFAPDRVKWILERNMIPKRLVPVPEIQLEQALCDEEYKSLEHEFCGFANSMFLVTFRSFLAHVAAEGATPDMMAFLASIKQERIAQGDTTAPYRSIEDIELITKRLLAAIGYNSGCVDVERVCDIVQAETGLQYFEVASSHSTGGYDVLGTATASPLTITIYKPPGQSLHRTRFTLAHELGHVCLGHLHLIISEHCDEQDILRISPVGVNATLSRMETQANIFASILLLPEEQFKCEFLLVAERLDIRFRNGQEYLFVDNQPTNQRTRTQVLALLSERFQVSKQAVNYRLKSLSLIKDISEPRSVRSIWEHSLRT